MALVNMLFPRNAARSTKFAGAVLVLVALSLAFALSFTGNANAASTAVPLGTASSFGVLAGAGITNTGSTTIDGDVGTYPTTSITGAASLTISGTNHAGDSVSQQAKSDLVTAYNDAAGQGPTSPISADLGGQSLTPGVYNSASSLGLTGTLTLNGGGDANAVFVFQAGSTLTTASGSHVALINGAQSCNVFWKVGSSATLGTGSSFTGTVIASSSITVTTGVQVDGRVLARDGAVTLDTDRITRPSCAAAVTTTTSASTATTSGATTTTTASRASTTTVARSTTTTTKGATTTTQARASSGTPTTTTVPPATPSPVTPVPIAVTG